MLNWANRFNIFLFLDSQQYSQDRYGRYECVLGICLKDQGLSELSQMRSMDNTSWYMGHFSYGLNHEQHQLSPEEDLPVPFPLMFLFRPEVVAWIKGNLLTIGAAAPESIYAEIMEQGISSGAATEAVSLQPSLTRQAYIEKILKLKAHIKRGDCYEINFCQEFFTNAAIEPVALYQELVQVSPNPFSAFYKLKEQYLLCASPERFLAGRSGDLISQPIKGTAPRDLSDPLHDEILKKGLASSSKEQSENVMVVDLVRNDLSIVCDPGSVEVEELFGIYAFPQVYQMISTVKGRLSEGKTMSDVMQACFPMGSMTGAPKQRVMELIAETEEQGRGIFSGSVGYIEPGGDFDFNVVIRSVMYNALTSYVSCQFGSGITIYCDPEKEWEECQLKALAIKKVLAQGQHKNSNNQTLSRSDS